MCDVFKQEYMYYTLILNGLQFALPLVVFYYEFSQSYFTSNIIKASTFLGQLLKFVINLNLIGMSSNFLRNISTCICTRTNEEFSPFHFCRNLANHPVL